MTLFFFLTRFWKLDLEERPHRQMVDVVEKAEKDPATPYGMLCVPRGTFKTSIARGTVVWKQLRQIYLYGNVYHRIALASATLALSRESLGSIENQLKYNGDLTSAYGPLCATAR